MFRSTVDALETTKKFAKQGIAFHSIAETLDTKSAMGKFFFTLTAALAEMEPNILIDHLSEAIQYRNLDRGSQFR